VHKTFGNKPLTKKDTNPNPSQPISKEIKLGINTNNTMETTNNTTNHIKRLKNGSYAIYEDENKKTQAEISNTKETKDNLIISKIKGSIKSEPNNLINSISNKTTLLSQPR
jgi:hypothetical protein